MLEVQPRNSFTAQAKAGFGPWILQIFKYSIGQINLGNNSNSRLEVVSLLNTFNLATDSFFYNIDNCLDKYNPKIYLGTIQTEAINWNHDNNLGLKNSLGNLPLEAEKSGSWPGLIF